MTALTFLLDWEVELELSRQLLLAVEPVREVNSPDPTVGVDLNSQSLHIVCPVGSPGEVGQVELNLIPALVKSHGHGADEGLDTRRRLIVGGAETTAHVLVIEDLDFEGEVLLQLFDKSSGGSVSDLSFIWKGFSSICDGCKIDLRS